MSALAIRRESIEFWRVIATIGQVPSIWEFRSEAQARAFKRQIEDEDPTAKASIQYGFND